MNLSRFKYFEALCRNIQGLHSDGLSKSLASILEEIDFQIIKICSKQKGGFWDITHGDKIFIAHLEKLKAIVADKKIHEIDLLIQAAKTRAENTIKVVFLAQESVAWPSFESVYHAMSKDIRYTVRLVYVPFSHINADKTVDYYQIYKEEQGLPILKHDEYSISEDSPDIAVFIKPYDCIPMQYYITEVNKVVRRCVYIPYAFFDAPKQPSIQYGYCLPLHYFAWMFIAYSQKNVENMKRYGYCNAKNAALLGHPRFDISSGINGYVKDQTTELYARKINNRRTLLWNTHHSITDGPNTVGAFLQYKDAMFKYFKAHNEMCLLWRPHPLLFGALITSGMMNKSEVDSMIQALSKEDNIIIDTSKDYINSFALSDGMIADGGPSMTLEYVSTGKPIYYTVKENGFKMPPDSIADCWYWIEDPSQLDSHLDRFAASQDPMAQKRRDLAPRHIGVVDGRCGERICEYIPDNIIREEAERAAFAFANYI